MFERPDPSEYDAFYSTYIDQVPDGEVLGLMASELERLLALLRPVEPGRETFRYADGKWSIREVVGHLIDSERVFGNRALFFARAEGATLPGMDQEVWSAAANAHERPLRELLDEFEHVRRGHVAMVGSLHAAAALKRGTASGR